jgi:hypothetical protein
MPLRDGGNGYGEAPKLLKETRNGKGKNDLPLHPKADKGYKEVAIYETPRFML